MIRRKQDINVRISKNARGGPGEVYFHDFMVKEDAPGHGRLFSKVVIPPGAGIGYHEHTDEFEAFYIISGEAVINDNGEEKKLLPGDLHICRNGDGHGVTNKAEQDLVMIALILNDLA